MEAMIATGAIAVAAISDPSEEMAQEAGKLAPEAVLAAAPRSYSLSRLLERRGPSRQAWEVRVCARA
jgi:hypothetical protein